MKSDDVELNSSFVVNNLQNGIKYVSEHVNLEFGEDVSVQILIITCSDNPIKISYTDIRTNFRSKFHILCFGKNKRVAEKSYFQTISQPSSGFSGFFSLDDDSPQKLPYLFKKLVDEHYCTFSTVLCLGHLQSDVQIVPSPEVILWSQIAMLHNLNLEFPSNISIIGFLPSRIVFGCPSITRFLLAPLKNKDESNLLLLLFDSLLKLKRTAVVLLGYKWYGLIHYTNQVFYQPDEGETDSELLSSLTLTVLTYDAKLDWIGEFDSLASQEEAKRQQNLSPVEIPFENSEPWPSYNPSLETPESFIMPCGDYYYIINQLSILQSFAIDLPYQRVSLFNQIERIRNLENLYHIDGFLDSIVYNMIKDTKKRSKNTLTTTIITLLLQCVKDKIFPIEWKPENENLIIKIKSKNLKNLVVEESSE